MSRELPEGSGILVVGPLLSVALWAAIFASFGCARVEKRYDFPEADPPLSIVVTKKSTVIKNCRGDREVCHNDSGEEIDCNDILACVDPKWEMHLKAGDTLSEGDMAAFQSGPPTWVTIWLRWDRLYDFFHELCHYLGAHWHAGPATKETCASYNGIDRLYARPWAWDIPHTPRAQ